MSRYIDADALIKRWNNMSVRGRTEFDQEIMVAPNIDICFCRECKHRPIKEDADGENYGFNLIEPNDGDERCPCLVADGWYSWMPEDDFYCGYGERESE